MSDCLRKNISVQQPIYCEDASGNVLPGSAMYEWMSVRSAGPNVLKDTTLCGDTLITQPTFPNPVELCLQNKPDGINPFYYCWMTDVLEDPIVSINNIIEIPMNDTSPALGGGGYEQFQWYPIGLQVCSNGIGVNPTNPPVDWRVSYQLNSDCQAPTEPGTIECLQKRCPDLVFPLLGYDSQNTLEHRIQVHNISGIKLQCHVFFNCTVDLTGSAPPGPPGFVGIQIGVGKIDKSTTEVTPNDVFQNSTSNFAFGSTGGAFRYATDFICEIDNDEVIVPVWRFATPIVAEDNALVWQTCGLTVQVVGFCDDNLPPAQKIDPPPGPGGGGGGGGT